MDEVEAVKVFNKTSLKNCQKSGRRNENGKTIIEYSEVPIKILREWIKKE